MPPRYDLLALTAAATALLRHAGMEEAKAATTAAILLEADLLGHDTHGLALLPFWLDELAAGQMLGQGEPAVLASGGAVQTWDGRGLPGPWLVVQAAEAASRKAAMLGLGAVAIRRSGHIGCLASYLRPIAERGQLLLITSSDPQMGSIAPWGGTQRLFSPNPIAAGWPTGADPVLMDVSLSATTNAMVRRHRAEGRPFATEMLLDGAGVPTRDADALFADPPGSILPLGAAEAGHKGAALILLAEALTSALAGHGRADAPAEPWRASVFVLVIDPQHFAGLDAFTRETGWVAGAVHASPPGPGGIAPSLPGERGLRRRADQIVHGVALHASIPLALAPRLAAAGLRFPDPLPPEMPR